MIVDMCIPVLTDVSNVQGVQKSLELKQRPHARDPKVPVTTGRRHGDQGLRPKKRIQK
jgi:hypothetical protein